MAPHRGHGETVNGISRLLPVELQTETKRNWCALLISRWREAVREFSLAMWRREANDDARAVVAKKASQAAALGRLGSEVMAADV